MASAALSVDRHPHKVRLARALAWPLGGLALVLALQFSLIFTRAINWDEFYFYHEVAKFAEGRLDRPLQTFHVRLFAWLPALHANTVDAIVTARIVQFGFEMATLAAIVLIAQRLSDTRTALFAALAYISAGYVLQHGFSFRVDPIATALLMGALAVLVRSRLRVRDILVFGVLAGLAGMVTMKAALFTPAFAGIAWWRWSERGYSRKCLAALAGCAVAAVVAFALLYWGHAQSLDSGRDAVAGGSSEIGAAGGWVFFLGLPPYLNMAIKSAAVAPVLYGCILAAPVMIARAAVPAAHKVALAGLWLPITTIAFYTNTAAYYYAFVLAPVAAASVLPLRWLLERYGPRMVAIALCALATGVWLTEDRTVNDRQRQLVANVGEIFEEPVGYFDQNFMLGAWPKGNGLMTPWGMHAYRESGEPAYRAAMAHKVVPLLLVNSEELEVAMVANQPGLFNAADHAALHANYRPFAGAIWMAGKTFGTGIRTEEFLVPGTYTLTGGPLRFDGVEYVHGDTLTVERGQYEIITDGAATLTWGDHLRQPTQIVEPGPLYVGF